MNFPVVKVYKSDSKNQLVLNNFKFLTYLGRGIENVSVFQVTKNSFFRYRFE